MAKVLHTKPFNIQNYHNNNNLWGLPPMRKFTVIPQGWRKLTLPTGRKLSDRVLQTLWTLVRMAQHNKSEELMVDYTFLEKQCGFGCSRDQLKRYLKDLAATKIIEYSIKRELYNSQKKLSIKLQFSFLKSLLTSDKETNSSVHVCPAQMPTPNKKNIGIEEKAIKAFSDNILYLNVNVDRQKNYMNLINSNQDKFVASSSDDVATISSQLPIPVAKSFGELTDAEIQSLIVENIPQEIQKIISENYFFTKLSVDKIGIRINNTDVVGIFPNILNDKQKEDLRSTIRKLWGTIAVVLVKQAPPPTVIVKKAEVCVGEWGLKLDTSETARGKFNRLFLEYYSLKLRKAEEGKLTLSFHFDPLRTDPSSSSKKIMLVGNLDDFWGVIDSKVRIQALEYVAKHMDIEIHCTHNIEPLPHIFTKDKTKVR